MGKENDQNQEKPKQPHNATTDKPSNAVPSYDRTVEFLESVVSTESFKPPKNDKK
ncbi:TPA: hypothetical protein ACVPFL_000831 [Morganella morganii]